MIQCSECEHFQRHADGRTTFTCHPFYNIKEPECLDKWQYMKLEQLAQAYQATVKMYEEIIPLQQKMFRHMERELEDQEEADSWKFGYLDDEEDEDEDDEDPFYPKM